MSTELNNIDLTPDQHKTVAGLLKRYIPDTEVWAYGSRVKFTSTPKSDLDLVAFATPGQKHSIFNLKEAFEESNLPFRVDLFIWNEVPEQFHKNIEAERVVLQEMKKRFMVSDWKKVSLGEVAILRNGAGVKQEFFSEHGVPLARVSDFTNDSVSISNCKYVDQEHARKWKSHLIAEGDVIVATVGSWPPNWSSVVGKVVRAPLGEKLLRSHRL